MRNSTETKTKKHLCIGILAHADAGKTTLSEGLLFYGGSIRKIGRVDHKDAFLDTDDLEKERGITIFSKQARLETENIRVTLLDTPGHVDFSSEMERTLQVLDYAVLVISGMDGVQSHTMTLWRLLERYRIPVFIFVNKMDQNGTDAAGLLKDIQKRLSENCIDFTCASPEKRMENIAVCDEQLLEEYLENGVIKEEKIRALIAGRRIFPCYFGSALKLEGVKEFLEALSRDTEETVYPEEFGARVYKISRDDQGNRLTFMKITGGSLKVKSLLSNKGKLHKAVTMTEIPDWEEKVDQIRLYSGTKFESAAEISAGEVCAVTGLTHTYPGEGLGIETDSEIPVLNPVLNYRILLPADCDVHQMLQNLRQLEEEDPQLHIVWDSHLEEIHAQLMGEVQTEILKRLIWDRFHVAVEFGTGSIVYKETVASVTEGVGHFEPLRHYAEVHLLIEPGEPGSGCQFFTACSEDVLARNWQRLILTHLEEKEHIGVLTGAALTDVQITLIGGRAHTKHTEGGDFRQATYRAVRQGLKKAKSVLLEPYYEFRLELPAELIGRAMSDITKMQGSFLPPDTGEETAVIKGTAAVSAMRDYPREVAAYTSGRGKIFLRLKGYAPCRNQDEIVEAIGYDSEADLENPTGSVFCAHGAGFIVPWDQVEDYMHLEGSEKSQGDPLGAPEAKNIVAQQKGGYSYSGSYEEEKELQAIFERTFGASKRSNAAWNNQYQSGGQSQSDTASAKYPKTSKPREEYLLVDGYNIIFSWEELKELAKEDLHAACTKLMDILSNYQGYKKCTLILVFDAYKLEGHSEETLLYHNIYVVYTKEAETADQYIEKTVHRLGKGNLVTVATSDGLEQIIIMGQGANRLSAKGLKKEIEDTGRAAKADWHLRRQSSKSYLFDEVSPDLAEAMEQIRLGENKK